MQGTKAAMRRAILSGIRMPRIGTKRLEAVPDAERLQTAQLQAAIDALSAAGGGTLVFPAGIYRTGALRLKSGVELQLASPQTEIRFTPEEPERNYPLVFSHWEASPCRNYSALLYACDAHDIAVTGSGTLDGGADRDHWWNWHHQVEESWSENRPDLQRADRSALRRMNEEGVPIPDRIFGGGHFLRPNFVQFLRCERVLLQGVTLHNSPMWQLNPVQCRSVIVDGMTLSSHGANNDGCDPESCSGVWIRNCRFDTGDDCISLKSGRDRDGRTANIPCENVLIEHNLFADGHGGIALGSEMSGGIRRVSITGCVFDGTDRGIRIKSRRGRGGAVEDVSVTGIVMNDVLCPLVINLMYFCGKDGKLPIVSDPNAQPVTDATPHVRRIRMADIVVTNAKSAAACLYGLPEAPLEDISIVNTQIHLVEDTPSFPVMNAVQQPVTLAGLTAEHVRGLHLTDLRIVGAREDEITLRDVE